MTKFFSYSQICLSCDLTDKFFPYLSKTSRREVGAISKAQQDGIVSSRRHI